MKNESRVKKSLLNAKINLICYFASFITAFFTRQILLDNLGTEFLGFSSTIGSILGFLNIAELGIGSTIAYVLYKPIFSGDTNSINEIISVLGYLYKKVGYIILFCGVILSFFLLYFFSDTKIHWFTIYLGFYVFLISSLLGYFLNYRAALLSADQRNYVITGYYQISTTVKVIIQMVTALLTQSFVLYFVFELLFGVLNSIILNKKIDKTYPWLKSESQLGRSLLHKYPVITQKIKQTFIHKIATFVQIQSLPMFIYCFVSLPMVAFYMNYMILVQKIQSLLTGLLDSTNAGIGSLIAEGDIKKIINVYKELFSIRFFISGILALCIFKLGSPTITLWLGNEYVLSQNIVFIISLMFFLTLLRVNTEMFLVGYGLFSDIWAPIVESILFIICSSVLGHFYNLEGVLMGPLVSTLLIVYCWKPYYLFKNGLKCSINIYLCLFITNFCSLVAALFIVENLISFFNIVLKNDYGWVDLIIYSFKYFGLLSTCSFVLFFIFSKGFRDFISRFKFNYNKINIL